MLKKINTELNEAYKQMGGDPAIDAVSIAAKGGRPETDDQQRMRLGTEAAVKAGVRCDPQDIENAYAMLFEALAVIMRK